VLLKKLASGAVTYKVIVVVKEETHPHQTETIMEAAVAILLIKEETHPHPHQTETMEAAVAILPQVLT
jgi:microcystin degradation protein MlrC